MMHDGRFRHVPIVEDGRPIGMVSVREALHTDFTELIELIDTPAMALAMGQAGRAYAELEHRVEVQVGRLQRVLEMAARRT